MSYPGLTIINKTITLPDGREIQIETGKLAKQADGSAVVKLGNAMILATVVAAKEAKPGVDFMPLSVDYQEKFASNGKIPGGFLKRESRLSDYEILISRLVDRAMRPLFPEDFHADTQVAITLISADAEVLPDALACLAAQAAMSVSDIPFNGPVSEVRVISLNGTFIVNPTPAQIEKAELELIVAASYDNVIMVEGEMNEVSEELMLNAIKVAHDAIRVQCTVLKELEVTAGKTEKRTYSHEVNDWDLKKKISDTVYQQVYEVAKLGNANKNERAEGFKAVKKAYIEALPEGHTEDLGLISKYYHDVEKDAVRNLILDERKRLDGRSLEQIRPIWSEVGYLPSAHGSAIFTRGETQSLTTVTLGTRQDEQMIDSAMFSGNNKLMLHYNFPGFSTGEVKPNRGPGRREVGHGNLAYRAIKKVMPPEVENPYTVRIVSDILESNGSSSMATVCAGTLALMDAGIKISAPVSGIAMGLITDTKTGRWAVLSDILGDEDHLGDMDFKVTGTEKGITACQMDIKVDGLSYDILSQALQQANRGRLHILNEMKKTIAQPNAELKPHTPRMIMIQIPKELIGAVIGPGGKIIQEMQKTSGATINIEEKDNAGWVSIFSKDKTALDSALAQIKGIVTLPEVGEVYEGKVKSITAFGAFVEFLPGKDGLLHISEIKWERLDTMDGVLEVGETVKVKLVEVDKKTGKYRLSRKVLIPKPEQQATPNS
ncbi:polyribonucleotide nucleotidyltransferase [Cytophaga aurantiaca]|uniref:polyribonucleotide nucleotidyltransferase n=1 Tax=Cytophaga aurantiaca TaxID=29530 RepID=UPI00036394DB|nr:polyribonucleotide nucleotidyltransferase [Cytophaga aurantiaca]